MNWTLLLFLFALCHRAPPIICAVQDPVQEPVSFRTGDFVVHYNPQSLPTLTVTQTGDGAIVWSSPKSSRNFVTADKINDTVVQIAGNFLFPNATPEAMCTDMAVTKVGTQDTSSGAIVTLQGTLCGQVAFLLEFEAVESNQLVFSVSMDQNDYYNQIRLSYACEEDEQFYGFGVQYSVFNMKGRRLPVFLSEQGVGRGLQPFTDVLDELSPGAGGSWHTTYSYVPQYVTSHSHCLMLTSLNPTVFDLTVSDTVTIELTGQEIRGRIITGKSILDLITTYTSLVGRLKPLPQWVGQGAVLGLQGGTEAVRNTLAQVERHRGNLNDVVGVWLQDWTGQRVFDGPNDLPRTGLWWNWEVDKVHYPLWQELIQDLRSKGIRTLTYINPLFSNVTKRGTPYTHNYLEEGLENGYFIELEDGSVWTGYGNSCMADLAQERVAKWLIDIITTNMLETGVCGWMCDFGESVPLNFKSQNIPGSLYHSLYPRIWAQLNTRSIEQMRQRLNSDETLCKSDDIIFFMRSGNLLSPSYSRAFWLGDQMVLWDSYDGLGTVVIGMLTGGLSGFSSTHSDIGGYTAIDQSPFKFVRTKELFMRWCELAAFTTIYRTHLGTLPEQNWQFNSDNETLDHFFRMAAVFQSWSFYRQQLMEEASEKGWPVARHMLLVFPSNPKVFEFSEELKFQFMLGTELLVVPVLQPFNTTVILPFVRVFLPAGTEWIHLWTNTVYKGADRFESINTPMGKPCVLYISGSSVGKQFVDNLKNRNIL